MVFWPRCPKQGMVLRANRLKLRMRAWLDGFLFNSSAGTQTLGFKPIKHYFFDFFDLNVLLNI